MGGSTAPVDNLHSGGLFAPIDLETGIISHPGYDKKHVLHKCHPVSGIPIAGFQIPFWKEVKKLARSLAVEVPQMRYIGWDIAVTETGPLMIEGNNHPGYDILQMPPHTPDRIGMLPVFERLMKEPESSQK